MGEKCYITNGNKVVVSTVGAKYSIGDSSLCKARRFKYQEGFKFMRDNMPNDTSWGLVKVSSVNSGKNYVVTNATSFAGKNGVPVHTLSEAKEFRNPAEAAAYLRNHRELKKSFGDCYIINEQLEVVSGDNYCKTFTDEQLNTIGIAPKAKRKIISNVARTNIYNKSNGRCEICGRPLTATESTIDHITPISRGGTNSMDNLRNVCSDCNALKGSRLDSEMYAALANICAIKAYDDPDNDIWNLIVRAKVRGDINKYSGAFVTDGFI